MYKGPKCENTRNQIQLIMEDSLAIVTFAGLDEALLYL
jgi:hypothetical protein